MLKILQAGLQQYVKHELSDVQAGFRKGRGLRDQIVNILWIIKKARELQKNICLSFIDYGKSFDCADQNKLTVENSSRDGKTRPPHLPLRNMYAGQEVTVRTGHETTDWFQIGKGVHQGCILSPCVFNLYAEYIMWNAGIKISGSNINNLRFADDTTLMAEREELKNLLIKLKEASEKAFLKLSIQKIKIMASSPINLRQTDGETMTIEINFIFLGSKITADGDCSDEIKRRLLLGRKFMTNLDSILKSGFILIFGKTNTIL